MSAIQTILQINTIDNRTDKRKASAWLAMTQEITYLVSNYNKGPYLADCMASLYAQTSSAWRCLICDDKSTDDSLAQIRPWLSDKIHLLQNECNQGVRYTLSRLIAEAPTDIVGVLDADDALYPEATALLLESYAPNQTAGFIYSNWTDYSADLRTPLRSGHSRVIPPGWSSLTRGYVGAIRTFRVSAYRQIKELDPKAYYAEDRDLVYRMEEVTPFYYLDHELYKYRQLNHSQSHDPYTREVALQGELYAYKKALDRRKISGIKRLGYLFYITNYYWKAQNHAPLRKRIAQYTNLLSIAFMRVIGCR